MSGRSLGDGIFFVKDRTLRTAPQLGISSMKSARIRNDRQKNFPRLRRGFPFFLPKVWGRDIFFSLRTALAFVFKRNDNFLSDVILFVKKTKKALCPGVGKNRVGMTFFICLSDMPRLGPFLLWGGASPAGGLERKYRNLFNKNCWPI